jgi:hypothetical protein
MDDEADLRPGAEAMALVPAVMWPRGEFWN